jgi:tetraacyldisaccharide 4'-kinase
LRQSWTRRGALACSLWPASWLFGQLVRLRQALYRRGWLTSEGVAVPLVVVGNVVVGGVGKTPVVMALVAHWQARGLAVGVISRGYGRHTKGCLEVTARSKATDVGDEPSLIQRRTQAPMFVAERRIDAARALLAAYPHTQIIVSDDGLQHLALKRDLEIGVFDDRGVGNGWLLPAGPLREPWPRQLDLVLHTGTCAAFGGFQAQRTLDSLAHRADGSVVPLADLARPPAAALPLLALAGIAQPEVFFAMLRAQGVAPEVTLALPDHYDFESFSRNEYKGYRLICTEKDAVKLWPLRPDALAVPLICMLPDAFLEVLDQRIGALLRPTDAGL